MDCFFYVVNLCAHLKRKKNQELQQIITLCFASLQEPTLASKIRNQNHINKWPSYWELLLMVRLGQSAFASHDSGGIRSLFCLLRHQGGSVGEAAG